MSRPLSTIAPDWWDYTTLDPALLRQAARLTPAQILKLSRPGFRVVFYDSLEELWLAEAMEYVTAWQQSTADNPVGICGPIGPTEQLPLLARIVNELALDVREGHFWGMDEWAIDGREVPTSHPLSFERTDRDLCFNRLRQELRLPDAHLHFPKADIGPYCRSWRGVRCAVMQGGQGDVKHWAFNDPFRRQGRYRQAPPHPEHYRKLTTRLVDLHPLTVVQNGRLPGGGNAALVPHQAISVGPVETWQADKVSIWHPGMHDTPFGQRLTAFMISERLVDTAVPMSLLADHPNVQFNFYRAGLGSCNH